MRRSMLQTISLYALLGADQCLYGMFALSAIWHILGFRIEAPSGTPYIWPFEYRLSFMIGYTAAVAVFIGIALFFFNRLPNHGKLVAWAIILHSIWGLTAYSELQEQGIAFSEFPFEYLFPAGIVMLGMANLLVIGRKGSFAYA